MKKKIISILLVLVLAISATVALVACDKTGSEENKWKSMTDSIDEFSVWVWELERDKWSPIESYFWTAKTDKTITKDVLENNSLPLNKYQGVIIINKNVDGSKIAKIKFTIEAEKEFTMKYGIGKVGGKEMNLKVGVNEIELDYETDMISNNLFSLSCNEESAGNYWSISNIKYLPKE